MTALTHRGLYRNSLLILGGLLGSVVLLVAGLAAAMRIATSGDQLLPWVGAALGIFVFAVGVCILTGLRWHRWTIDGNAVLIEEWPLVPMTGRRRERRVPLGAIVALRNVQNAADELLTLSTRDGEQFALPPDLLPGNGLTRKPDQAGLAAFAGRLQAAMTAAGHAAPPVVDGLGFWNRPTGLALLGVTLLASLAVAAATLWGVWEGVTGHNHRGSEAVALLVLLPVGVGWVLRRSWQRRRSVLRAMRQSHPFSS